MTTITKPVSRLTDIEVQCPKRRALVVTLEPGCLAMRGKGTRTVVRLAYGQAYWYAARLQAEADRAERKAKRKGRSA